MKAWGFFCFFALNRVSQTYEKSYFFIHLFFPIPARAWGFFCPYAVSSRSLAVSDFSGDKIEWGDFA